MSIFEQTQAPVATVGTTVKVDEQAGTLTVVIALANAQLSPSGKTRRVASTCGNKRFDAQFRGQEITLGLNAWIQA